MARRSEVSAVYEVADEFRHRCLLERRSLLWPEHKVWTSENLSRIRGNFGNVPDNAQSEKFLELWHEQLANESEEIHRVAADLLAFYWLCPTTAYAETKLRQIRE